jgi:hypothetical protein
MRVGGEICGATKDRIFHHGWVESLCELQALTMADCRSVLWSYTKCYVIFEVFYGVIQNVRECYSIFLLDLFLATCFPTYQTPGWFEDECSPISDSWLFCFLSNFPVLLVRKTHTKINPPNTPTPNHRWQKSKRSSGTHAAAVVGAETRITSRTCV